MGSQDRGQILKQVLLVPLLIGLLIAHDKLTFSHPDEHTTILKDELVYQKLMEQIELEESGREPECFELPYATSSPYRKINKKWIRMEDGTMACFLFYL